MKRIVVLGMHRSGATALTHAIGRLGADVGNPRHVNKSGENTPLRRINNDLLEASGGCWEAPPAGEGWLTGPAARGLAGKAARTLESEFGSAPLSVWKDPRTSLTLPFWLDHFDEEPVIVLVHRHPAEVAASVASEGVTGTAWAYALWERYNAAALTAAAGLPTIVLDYGQVMTFPAEAATFVSKALRLWDVALPNDPADTDVGLSPALRHQRAPHADRLESPVVTPSQAALFALLDAVAGAHRPLTLPQPVPQPDQVSTEILQLAATIRRLERERREERQAERKSERKAQRVAAASTTVDVGADTAAVAGNAAAAGDAAAAAERG